VTDRQNIAAIITDRGVIEKPDEDKIRQRLTLNRTLQQ
jgi:methylthioribose-1-phosphate isomerase